MTVVENLDDRRNMSPVDEIFFEIDELYQEAKNWADGAEIENEDQHNAAKAVHDALHEAGKKAEELRVKEKEPLDEQVKAIQDKFNPYTQKNKGKVDLGKTALKQILGKWREKIAEQKRIAADKAAKEAEEQRIAAEAAIQTSFGNLEAREEAEQLVEEAKASEKSAKRADRDSKTGTGLRRSYTPVLTDMNKAVRHYWDRQPEAFRDLVLDLAAKDVRAGVHDIPGFDVREEKKAI